MRLKTVILLACLCVLTVSVYSQNQSPAAYGNITATASDCTATPAACVSLHFPYSNTGVVGIQVTGTWVATLAAQGSSDNGANWFTVNMTPYTSSNAVSSTAANGNWQAFVGGLTDFRIRASAYTSGTAIVVLNSTSAVGAGAVETQSGTGASASQVQGAGATNTSVASINPILISAVNASASMQNFVCGGSGTTCGMWAGPNSVADAISGTSTLGLPYNPGNGGADTGGLRVNPVQYNGTTLDTQRNASLANDAVSTTLTARNSIGASLSEKGSRWTVIHNPAANSQATASIASEASVRHVVDCVSFSAGAIVAPALTALTVNVRDGATGAGNIIWTFQVIIPAATGQSVAPHSICGLNLVGTTATAMTAEFSAGLTSLSESVSISGYNVN